MTYNRHRFTIGVLLTSDEIFPERLLNAISTWLPFEFVILQESEFDTSSCAAALLFGAPSETALQICSRGIPCLAFPGRDVKLLLSPHSTVRFSASTYLSGCLRNRSLSERTARQLVQLQPESGDEVLATRDRAPIWIRRQNGRASLDLVAIPPPILAEGEYLFKYLQQDDWASLLPLLHFLHSTIGFQVPPIRACFMFDDPNLRWKTYGYIRYCEIVAHAHKHNYHASIATVPLDAWYIHKEAATLFRENFRRLSLVIHGNDHTYFELMQPATDSKRRALAAQALRRIQRLEQASGIQVPRIMAAPHGACNPEMANALLQTGFAAACISRSSLMARNPTTAWKASVGLTPAEFLGEGLPVMPRLNIRWDSNLIVFAAFLGQPIILVGHHDDLSDGLDLLQVRADFINSLGQVNWADMRAIADGNYCAYAHDEVFCVTMYSRHITLNLPERCRYLSVTRPWLNGRSDSELCTVLEADVQATTCFEQDVAISSGVNLKIDSPYPKIIDLQAIPTCRPTVWAVVRRQLCEARDRAKPIINKFVASKNLEKLNHRIP